MGRYLIIFGIVCVAAGLCLQLGFKPPSWFGRLPGDILIKKESFQFYFPLTTCLLISLVLTLLSGLFRH